MQTAFIDGAIVTAIQDEYQARARSYAGTRLGRGRSTFARLASVLRTRDRGAALPTARTVVGGTRTAVRAVPGITHGISS